MNTEEEFFLNFFATALNKQNYLRVIGHNIPESVIQEYLLLNGDTNKYEYKLRNKFEGISKERFKKVYNLTELEVDLNAKYQAFKNWIVGIETNDTIDVNPNKFSIGKKYSNLYEFFQWVSGHKGGKEFEVNEYKKDFLHEMSDKMQQMGKLLIKLKVLREIKDELEFSTVYNPNKKILVDTSAEACGKAYKQIEKEKGRVTKKELINRVLNNFILEDYLDEDPDKAQKRITKNINQWIRDQNNNKNSHFSIEIN